MKINLADIPEEGHSYTWNNQTKDIAVVLADLIGKAEFHIEFFIKPITTKDFDLSGSVKTKLPEECSRCGISFAFPINEKFHEILIPKLSHPRGGKYSKVNHVSDLPDNGTESLEYEGQHFDAGEYIHEVIALAAPFNPAGPENEDGNCSICEIPVAGRSFSYTEEMPPEKPQSPFANLKNIKIN